MLKSVLRRCGRAAIAAFALVGFGVAVISATPLVSWYARRLAGPWNDPLGDILIVPGGSIVDAEAMGPSSQWRAIYAARAYHQGFQRIVVSGAVVSGQMRLLLIAMGVPATAIQVEDQSRSTRENALCIARLLKTESGRKVLMTSDYHMARAVRAFRKAGVDAAPRPIPDGLKRAQHLTLRWEVFLDEAAESAKIAYYFVRGWI